MTFRILLVGLAATSLTLVAGCPMGFGGGSGPYDYAIPDGTYVGKLNLTASFWENGWDDGQDFDAWDDTKTFQTGDLINYETGDWFYPGDRDTVDFGSLQLARVVTDVEQFDWGYHVLFDVTGNWYEVPVSGTEDADYVVEYDGSVSVEDTMQLTSLWEYDGGAWEIEVYVEGNLVRSGSGGNAGNSASGGNSGNSGSGANAGNNGNSGANGLPPWFNEKSGKIRR